ncbi:MAG: hypothetical protein JW782_07405 [Candidatus Saganbacteria bacterium]|nr:hypothetical protein [Candidatus Saganbacteria bacterium]
MALKLTRLPYFNVRKGRPVDLAARIIRERNFPRFSLEQLPEINATSAALARRSVAGLFCRYSDGLPMMVSAGIPKKDARPLDLVECGLFQPLRSKWSNLWLDNLFPIMGGEVYHRDGSFYTDEELAACGLRRARDANGRPLKLLGFAIGSRVVSFPGPWIVPYVRQGMGVRLIKDKKGLEAVAGRTLTKAMIAETILRLVEQDRLELRIASDLQFKGAGCMPYSAFHSEYKHLEVDRPIYLPELPFHEVGRGKGLSSSVGGADEREAKAMANEEQLRANGAVFLADMVSVHQLFSDRDLPRFRTDGKYHTVAMSLRLSYDTFRLHDIITSSPWDGFAVIMQKDRLPFLKRFLAATFAETDMGALFKNYFRRLAHNWAKNFRAAFPAMIRYTDMSNTPSNIGPIMEMIDTASLEELPRPGKDDLTLAMSYAASWLSTLASSHNIWRILTDGNAMPGKNTEFFASQEFQSVLPVLFARKKRLVKEGRSLADSFNWINRMHHLMTDYVLTA